MLSGSDWGAPCLSALPSELVPGLSSPARLVRACWQCPRHWGALPKWGDDRQTSHTVVSIWRSLLVMRRVPACTFGVQTQNGTGRLACFGPAELGGPLHNRILNSWLQRGTGRLHHEGWGKSCQGLTTNLSFDHPLTYSFIQLPTHLLIHPTTHPLLIHLTSHPPTYSPTHPLIHLPSIHPSNLPPIHPYMHPSINPSIQ